MKVILVLLFFQFFLFPQSKIIYLNELKLQLDKNKAEILIQAMKLGFEIKDNGNGNYYLKLEVDGIIYQANVRFIDDHLVSASKIWGYYPISNSFKALKDYFNLLEKQQEEGQLNAIFTQRFTDIDTENFIITNSFGEYRIEISFDSKSIITKEDIYKVNK